MYKDILVPLANAAVDDLTLATGIELARAYDAHLTALVTVSLSIPIGFEMTTFPADVYERLHEVERARGEGLAQKTRERLRPEDISWEVRSVESPMLPSFDVAVMHARHADLTIVPGAVDRADYASSTFADLLTGSGRPWWCRRNTRRNRHSGRSSWPGNRPAKRRAPCTMRCRSCKGPLGST